MSSIRPRNFSIVASNEQEKVCKDKNAGCKKSSCADQNQLKAKQICCLFSRALPAHKPANKRA